MRNQPGRLAAPPAPPPPSSAEKPYLFNFIQPGYVAAPGPVQPGYEQYLEQAPQGPYAYGQEQYGQAQFDQAQYVGLKIRTTSNPVTSYFYIGLALGCIDADLYTWMLELVLGNFGDLQDVHRPKFKCALF